MRRPDDGRTQFERNPASAVANLKAHEVSFAVAKTVFYDDFAALFFDQGRSNTEGAHGGACSGRVPPGRFHSATRLARRR